MMSIMFFVTTGVLQVCVAPILIVGRRRIADWLGDHVPPLDVAGFRGHGEYLIGFGRVSAAISGGLFIGLGAVDLTYS